MLGGPFDQTTPPELPPFLKNVCDLKPIQGAPSDEEIIGIHAVVRVANKAADIQGVGDPTLLPQLLGHLFDVQMAKYQSKYSRAMFPENSTYTPPPLPVHITVQLGPVAGAPSEEEIGKVHEAIRSYQQFAHAPSLFDPRVDMELHQHLFDIQMARHRQRARNQVRVPTNLSSTAAQETNVAEENMNNAGTGDNATQPHGRTRPVNDASVHEAIERSNRLAEQTNQLAERANILIEQSNRISERANQLLERANTPVEQPSTLAERFNGLFERLNQHMEESNRLTKESMQPVEKLGDILRNMNRVLVRVQHAIVRNHKGNSPSTLNCLVNERGETPAISETTSNFPMIENGSYFFICVKDDQCLYVPDGAEDGNRRTPLQGMPSGIDNPALILIQSLGDNRYRLSPARFPDRVIAAHRNNDRKILVLAGPEEREVYYTEWAIDVNDNDQYELRACDGSGNEYWTSPGEGREIDLQASQGIPSQQWEFQKVD